MLRVCALEWTGDWDKYLYLVEIAYNNSCHVSIGMPPFEALYGRRCRAPSCWDEHVLTSVSHCIRSRFYRGPNATAPPPLVRYCADDSTLEIIFPDWSFWGWPEINIKPWDSLLKDLKEGNTRISWMDRDHFAYWKGNPVVTKTRMDLLKCNVSEKQDWNARVYAQDLIKPDHEAKDIETEEKLRFSRGSSSNINGMSGVSNADHLRY
ncbi:hypothetical protein AgCh_039828 [Apium graveolens]